jgi:subtilisin family serine protease
LGGVICTGAIDWNYQKARFSNTGSNVVIHAPGAGIIVPSFTGDESSANRAGTSLAAPFVAGVVAHFIGFEAITDVGVLQARLFDNMQSGILGGLPSSTPNNLVNSGLFHPDKPRDSPYYGAPEDPNVGKEIIAVATFTDSYSIVAPSEPTGSGTLETDVLEITGTPVATDSPPPPPTTTDSGTSETTFPLIPAGCTVLPCMD